MVIFLLLLLLLLLLLVLLLMFYYNNTEGSYGQCTSLSSYEVPDVYVVVQLDVLTIMGWS